MAQAPAKDPDFAPDVLKSLYRYPRKHYALALPLALVGGVLGLHRAYVGHVLSAMAMFLSVGGFGLWWLWNLVTLRRMVEKVNAEQARRETAGLPPRALAFLPPLAEQGLLGEPAWTARRRGRLALLGTAALLFLLGLSQGAVSAATGVHEPLVTVCVFLFASLLVARLRDVGRVPGLGSLSQWLHRLRLFYYHVDPGPVWLIALRPVFGVFALLRPKVRAEVQLHLQLGFVFSVLFLLGDLGDFLAASTIGAGFGVLVGQFLQTLIYTYMFVAPIGALVTTQILLQRSDRVVWMLTALTLVGVGSGWTAVP